MQKTDLGSSSKTFKHDFVGNLEEIEAVYEGGKRFYLLPDGQKVPSVTTVLSSLNKEQLERWRQSVGEEEAERVRKQATVRGTAVHEICEKYLRNEDYKTKTSPIHLDTFSQIKPILDNNVDTIYGIELPLFSYRLKTAGRTDCIAEWNGTPAIIDFKTSKKPKKREWIENYFIQATCYSLMCWERINIKVPNFVIIIAVDHEEPQVFHEKVGDYLDKTVRLFRNHSR